MSRTQTTDTSSTAGLDPYGTGTPARTYSESVYDDNGPSGYDATRSEQHADFSRRRLSSFHSERDHEFPQDEDFVNVSQQQGKQTVGFANGTTRQPSRVKRIASGIRHNPSILARKVSKRIPGMDRFLGLTEEEVSKLERTLYFNQPVPAEEINPETGFPITEYPRNKIRTTKYTPLNFVPKNLFYQFHNIANIYFLFIVILSAFSIFGVVNPGLSAVPIIAIVIITAIKDAIEDYRRAVLDSELNNTVSCSLSNFANPNVADDNISGWRRFKKASTRAFKRTWTGTKRLFASKKKQKEDPAKYGHRRDDSDLHTLHTIPTNATGQSVVSSVYGAGVPGSEIPSARDVRETTPGSMGFARDTNVIDESKDALGDAKFKRNYWKNIKCGDIIKVFNDEEVPADVVVLSTSDADGACYIETRNLDGETNLKSRQSLKATEKIRRARDLERSSFKIQCERPNPALYTFNGVLKYNSPQDHSREEAEPVSINNLLLRGSSLRNTKWAIGIVVYTGIETKIMLNSGATPAKRSRMIRELNINVVINFVFLFILALVAGIVEGVYFHKNNSSATFFEFGSIGGSAPVDGLVTFWAAVILLQNLIPISLYISIEIIKTIQAFFIYSDIEMYYEPIDYPCVPKSWSISDDVGQVEYIFSDKTGTLTQNVMEFRKCTINGKTYGNAFTEAMIGMMKRSGNDSEKYVEEQKEKITLAKEDMLRKLRSSYENPYLYDDDMPFVSPDIVDDIGGASGEEQQSSNNNFFLALALCHGAIPEFVGEGKEKIIFKAQSPDDAALVATAKDLGFTLVERTRTGVILDINGVRKEYEVLIELEFSSARKRMSVIVRDPESEKLLLITKGADSVIYSRLVPGAQQELKEATAQQLEEFANEGLRTLCLAQRELSVSDYERWRKRYDSAASALQDREEKIEEAADEIERNLTLIGGTAIEDRLQDGVPDAIALLGRAGIKLWVLTGDKVETAINIGYSCSLLENNMELLVLQAGSGTTQEVGDMISKHLQEKFNLTGSSEEIVAAKKDHSPPGPKYATVIDGDTLALVLLDPEICTKFVLLCKQCRSVLCCRVSPAQKAAVVRMVKTTLDVTTLSVGDGANDVAMIQEADVGVGIAGVEGRQAVMSSDYAIGQFRFLCRLVLVHGRWSYNRLAEMTANLFYKNVVFTLTLFWYDVHNSFDGSYLFDYTYITLFNLAFTSLPVIFMGFSDQDVSDKVVLAVPQLYRRGILRLQWTNKKFWIYMVDGVYQSAVCYFLSFSVFYNGGFVTMSGRQINYREAYGVFTATAAIAACNLYVMMNQYRWDWLFSLIVFISIGLVFFWTGIYTQFLSSAGFYKAAGQVYGSLPFWANTLLVLVICLLPRFTCKAYQKLWMPYDVDIIREQVKQHKFDYLYDNSAPTYDGSASTNVSDTSSEKKTTAVEDERHPVASERMRMSLDIPEMTTARSLMSTTQIGN
ncbi:aminophospholipid-translocating P4-type ATPase DNF1 [Sugiyamaella lignohabitans]|uniref:Phospholipid-transporting ATPase n=1 Tax=Sugiyamaella lignohabitans TaxID=796027 RepID=A0A167DMY9_9ASCO|nr:aminophospholipid-translocating P4-type ATPase DNF1 [Sugiyamaella lignohabitans]ANB13088.1 aminophospholipid-translocating P4-type ATPase DNF1 [Sugiyamaella lignohabitans]